jgi:cbb3-type cytochrome oxidase subunit 1
VDAELGRHDQRLMTLSGAWDKLRTDPSLRFS